MTAKRNGLTLLVAALLLGAPLAHAEEAKDEPPACCAAVKPACGEQAKPACGAAAKPACDEQAKPATVCDAAKVCGK